MLHLTYKCSINFNIYNYLTTYFFITFLLLLFNKFAFSLLLAIKCKELHIFNSHIQTLQFVFNYQLPFWFCIITCFLCLFILCLRYLKFLYFCLFSRLQIYSFSSYPLDLLGFSTFFICQLVTNSPPMSYSHLSQLYLLSFTYVQFVLSSFFFFVCLFMLLLSFVVDEGSSS